MRSFTGSHERIWMMRSEGKIGGSQTDSRFSLFSIITDQTLFLWLCRRSVVYSSIKTKWVSISLFISSLFLILTKWFIISFFFFLSTINIDKTIINFALKFESDKYCETKLFSKMNKYYETDGVISIVDMMTFLIDDIFLG